MWTILISHLNPSPNRLQIENEERKPQPSDKSSPPQPSSIFACPNPPHHTPELTATEFYGAVCENELRKPTALRQKLPPSSIFACPNLHHTTHRCSLPQRSPELCLELGNIPEPPWATIQRFFLMIFPFPQFGFRIIDGFFGFMGFFGASWIIYGINVISWLLIFEDKAILARSKAIWRGYYIQIWCRTLFHIGFQSSLIAFCLGSNKSFNCLMGHLYFLFLLIVFG